MKHRIGYFQYAVKNSTSHIGWSGLLLLLILWAVTGIGEGPLQLADFTYAARVVKREIVAPSPAARGPSHRYARIVAQDDRELRHVGYSELDAAYPGFVRALSPVARNDRITVHGVASNYGPEAVWKIDSEKAGVVFETSRDEAAALVREKSVPWITQARRFERYYPLAALAFLLWEFSAFRRYNRRVVVDSVVYRASRVLYAGQALAMACLGGLAIVIGLQFYGSVGFQLRWQYALLYLLPAILVLACAGFGYHSLRTLRTIRHDLVLGRGGLHWPELLADHGTAFVPWSNIAAVWPRRSCIEIGLREALPRSGAMRVEIDTTRLADALRLADDIASGIAGDLFQAPRVDVDARLPG